MQSNYVKALTFKLLSAEERRLRLKVGKIEKILNRNDTSNYLKLVSQYQRCIVKNDVGTKKLLKLGRELKIAKSKMDKERKIDTLKLLDIASDCKVKANAISHELALLNFRHNIGRK